MPRPAPHLRPGSCARVAAIALLAAPIAHAQLRVHLSAELAAPFERPQRDQFGLGGGGGGAAEWALTERAGVLGRVHALALPPFQGALPEGVAHPGTGTAAALLLGARLRPAGRAFGRASEGLWLEAAGGAALTGGAVRPALSARAGLGYSVGPLGVGPYVGYTRVFDLGDSPLPGDASIVSLGLEVSVPAARPAPRSRPAAVARAAVPARPGPRACPRAARLTFGDVDGDGCPDDDRDGDGIATRVDRCPDIAEDHDGFRDDDGCPDDDNDDDSVADPFDACPDAREVINGVRDDDGCPDEAPVQVAHGRIVLQDRIQFRFASSRIQPESQPLVRAVADVLRAHPEYRTVHVEGHADEVGPDAYNYTLSFRRARAVVAMLVQYGIERQRLVPLGFGRSHPLVREDHRAARARNRRVEFVVDGHLSAGRALSERGYIVVSPQEAQP